MEIKRLLSMSLLSIFLRSLGVIGSVLFPFLLSNELPIEKVGAFLFPFSIFMFVANISRVGADNLFVKKVAAEDSFESRSSLVWEFAFLVFLTSCVGALLTALFFHVFGLLYKDTLWLFIGIPFFALSVFISFYFQATKKMFVSNMLFNALFYLFLLLMLTFVNVENINQVTKAVIYSCFMNFLVSSIFLIKNVGPPKQLSRVRLFKIVRALKPFFVTATMAQIIIWAGQIITGFWADSEDVALLIVAQRISLVISFILIAVNFVTTPIYANLFSKNDLAGIAKLSARSSKIMTLVSLAAATSIFLFADRILGLFGDEYKSALPLVLILCFAQLVNAITGSVGYLMAMTGNERVLRNVSIFSASFLILLCLSLCPAFGALGGAIATASAVIVQNCILVFSVKKHLGFWTIRLR